MCVMHVVSMSKYFGNYIGCMSFAEHTTISVTCVAACFNYLTNINDLIFCFSIF